MSHLVPLPALTDNYIWAFPSSETATSWAVVDPGEAEPVMVWLHQHQATLSHILVTHHHHDHVGGIPELLKHHPNATIMGPASTTMPWITHVVQNSDQVRIGSLPSFQVLTVPGHTLDHIAWWNDDWLFCGDTLFSLGCGRVFEGTLSQMYTSINALMALPDHLWVCAGHEYTLNNMAFLRHLMPNNAVLKPMQDRLETLRQQHRPTLPTRLHFEKAFNPYCNTTNTAFIDQLTPPFTQHHGLALFEMLRQAKDTWCT